MATSLPSSRLAGRLEHFHLSGIRDTGITVGDGSYATVLRYDFRGLKCVGKKIHRLLYEHASFAQRADMLRRFEEECELLGRLHHPNIVQFLGVHVEKGSELPALVMEYLPTNLSGYLDRHGILSAELCYSILRDVALGLRYLHEYSPPIVHRDLSANNVLLTTSLSAKISDLGVSKILNITPSQMTQKMSTKAPGTPCYMPPEALMSRPSYTRKIDSYSFGVLILHVLCGEWPFPADPFQRDPHNAGIFVPVTEVDRRAEFLLKMGSDHPLSGLVRQCLSNAPDERPKSADILRQINSALSHMSLPAETVYQQVEDLKDQIQKLESGIQRVKSENQTFGSEVKRLGIDNQRLENENQSFRKEIQSLRNEIQTLRKHPQTPPSSNSGAEMKTLRGKKPTSSGTEGNQQLIHKAKKPSLHDLHSLVRATNDTKSEARAATSSTKSELHPGARLQWRRCADVPVEMSDAHAVVVGETVYVGGGTTIPVENAFQLFQYNRKGDTWSTLPRCPVKWFGLANFMGRVITVGGVDLKGSLTGKVHALREEFQKWEEFLIPMPTARICLSVATTSEAIIAAGGDTSNLRTIPAQSSAVEVYSSKTSRWHTADPLPIPCAVTSSVVIDNMCYLLGGVDQSSWTHKNCWCASLPSLIKKAVSSTPHSVGGSVWSHLPPTPLYQSAAACLNGSLMSVGGLGENNIYSPAVYAFHKNMWVRLRKGDLLSPRSSCATALISPVEMIVIGGWATIHQRSKSVFIGTLHPV